MGKFGIISICIIFIGIVIGSVYLWNINSELKKEQQSFEKEKITLGKAQKSFEKEKETFKKEQAAFEKDKVAFAEEVKRTKEETDNQNKALEQAKNVQLSQTTSTSQTDSQTNQSNTTTPPKTNTVLSNDNVQNQNNSIIQQVAQIDSQLINLDSQINATARGSQEYENLLQQKIDLLKKKQSLLSQLK